MLRMIESMRNITKFLYSHAYVLSLTRKQNGNNKLVYSLLVDIMDSNCMHFMSPFLDYLLLIISSLPHFIYSHATYIMFLLNPHLFAIEPHLKLNLTRICNVKKLPQAISKYCTTHTKKKPLTMQDFNCPFIDHSILISCFSLWLSSRFKTFTLLQCLRIIYSL